MLAIAYRNRIEGPIGLAASANSAVRDVSGHSGRRSGRREQRLAAESLLKDLLELVVGGPLSRWQIKRNHDGQPTLVDPACQTAIEVSLSHSGPIALAGITDLGKIGVDLEYRNPARPISEIAAFAFGPEEQRVVESVGLVAFYRIWTLREALAKACGIGFPMVADGRDYFLQPLKASTWQDEIDGQQWLFSSGELPGDYVFSIAVALRSPFVADCREDMTPRQIIRV